MRGRQERSRGSGSLIEALSDRNPRVKRLRRLMGRRSFRAEESSIVIEGPTLVREALRSDLVLDEVFVERSRVGEFDGLVDTVAAAGTDVRVVTDGVLDRLGGAVTSQGIAAIGTWAPLSGDAATARLDLVRADGWLLVLDEIGDPGNAGTLIRTAEAVGAGAVVFAGPTVDPASPKVVRSSAGSLFRVPVIAMADSQDLYGVIRRSGFELIGAVADGGEPHDGLEATGPVAVVLGSEAHGLSAASVESMDRLTTISLVGPTESLNAAMAGTVLAFEVLRQRQAATSS